MNSLVKSIMILAGLILVAVFFFFVVRPAVTDWRAMRNLTPEMRDDFEQWHNEPIGISADEIKLDPYTDEFTEAATSFLTQWNEVADQFSQDSSAVSDACVAIRNGRSFEPVNLSAYDSILSDFTALSNTEGYSFENFLMFIPNPEQRKLIPVIAKSLGQLKLMEVQTLINESKLSQAINAMQEMQHSFEPSDYSLLITMMISNTAYEDIASVIENLDRAQLNAEQKEAIKSMLEDMSEDYDTYLTEDALLIDNIAMIKQKIKSGAMNGIPNGFENFTGTGVMKLAAADESANISRAVAAQSYAISKPGIDQAIAKIETTHKKINDLLDEFE